MAPASLLLHLLPVAGTALPRFVAFASCTPYPNGVSTGGAFPEIHVAQYPLDMGRPDKGAGGSGTGGGGQTLALTVNAEGDINYDAVLTQSRNSQKWLQTTHKALVPKVDELAAGVGASGCQRLQRASGQLHMKCLRHLCRARAAAKMLPAAACQLLLLLRHFPTAVHPAAALGWAALPAACWHVAADRGAPAVAPPLWRPPS